jgi:predicted metalloprotease with PDZ domain
MHLKLFLQKFSKTFTLALALGTYTLAQAQDSYRYSIDLTKAGNDQLQVELLTPKVKGNTATLSFAHIIPGTYSISDYGQFISDVAAYDKAGKKLAVKKLTVNKWQIANAAALNRITYKVEDIFDSKIKHKIYPMAATNFEEGKNFVFNTPGLLGFIDGLGHLPFEMKFTRPADFYASTSLKPVSSSGGTDVFRVASVNELYDAPIMYTRPDTTTVRVGNCDVLVSVYSPNGMIRSAQLADWMGNLLEAARNYLGGKLPADRYAFLYYFHEKNAGHSFPQGLGGALEHPQSSFYYVEEGKPEELKDLLVNISSHEFFHIITPLTIASREVKEFNFDKAVLSRHLWLYEGVTEYTAHHVQVKHGLTTRQKFFDELSQKITISRKWFNDSLPFTVMSQQAADKYAQQYQNVYLKGALIAASLDLYLLELSDGHYGLRNLTYDLGVRYGKEKWFEDEKLFDEIAKLTYPEVKDFLVRYVAGAEPIPYEKYFAMAGIRLTPKVEKQIVSLGGFTPVPNEKGQISIGQESQFTEMGKALGLKHRDEIYAFNGVRVTPQNIMQVIDNLRKNIKEGETLSIRAGRANASGTIDTLELSAPFKKSTQVSVNVLDALPGATARQMMIQDAWLKAAPSWPVEPSPVARAEDVSTSGALVNAVYSVISGPAGVRDWNRFHSLFYPGAMMGALVQPHGSDEIFHKITPKQYQQTNDPFFRESGFFEEELGRKVLEQGNIATVQSAYQFRMTEKGPVAQRGINYMTLMKINGRWYVTHLVWQVETPQNPIPADLLKR